MFYKHMMLTSLAESLGAMDFIWTFFFLFCYALYSIYFLHDFVPLVKLDGAMGMDK